MSNNNKLIVGDQVHWKGSWGSDPQEEVTVTGIQINFESEKEEGYNVEEVDWDRVVGRDAIVDLNNGHWAWAFQISRIKYTN